MGKAEKDLLGQRAVRRPREENGMIPRILPQKSVEEADEGVRRPGFGPPIEGSRIDRQDPAVAGGAPTVTWISGRTEWRASIKGRACRMSPREEGLTIKRLFRVRINSSSEDREGVTAVPPGTAGPGHQSPVFHDLVEPLDNRLRGQPVLAGSADGVPAHHAGLAGKPGTRSPFRRAPSPPHPLPSSGVRGS